VEQQLEGGIKKSLNLSKDTGWQEASSIKAQMKLFCMQELIRTWAESFEKGTSGDCGLQE